MRSFIYIYIYIQGFIYIYIYIYILPDRGALFGGEVGQELDVLHHDELAFFAVHESLDMLKRRVDGDTHDLTHS